MSAGWERSTSDGLLSLFLHSKYFLESTPRRLFSEFPSPSPPPPSSSTL